MAETEKKENKLAKFFGHLFAYTTMICASALVIAITTRLIMWILGIHF